MTPTEKVRAALDKFEGVTWVNHGEPGPDDTVDGDGIGWVKFGVEKSELGWRTLEFLAWAIMEDLKRAEYQLLLFPTSPPPYLNGPGECLAFALEMLDDGETHGRGKGINEMAQFLNEFHS